MVDRVSINSLLAHEATNGSTKKVLNMVKNERMGGYVPSWDVEELSPGDKVEHVLEMAQNGQSAAGASSFDAALAYQQNQNNVAPPNNEGKFGFGDLIDMVNPLHHIPLVGHAYRSLSGDEIKPVGQVIGGAIFGGPIGAGIGIANAIIEEETGKDMGEIAIAMAFDGEGPKFRHLENQNNPEEVLEYAVDVAEGQAPGQDLPASLLAFTPQSIENSFHIEKVIAANGRTAGEMTSHIKNGLDNIAKNHETHMQHKLETMTYEPMSHVELATMSDLY